MGGLKDVVLPCISLTAAGVNTTRPLSANVIVAFLCLPTNKIHVKNTRRTKTAAGTGRNELFIKGRKEKTWLTWIAKTRRPKGWRRSMEQRDQLRFKHRKQNRTLWANYKRVMFCSVWGREGWLTVGPRGAGGVWSPGLLCPREPCCQGHHNWPLAIHGNLSPSPLTTGGPSGNVKTLAVILLLLKYYCAN